MDVWLNPRKLVNMFPRPVSPRVCLLQDWCLPRRGIGQSSSTDSSPYVTTGFNENDNVSHIFSGRSQLIGIEGSHRESATQDTSRTEFQPQVFQQQDRQYPFDHQKRTGELKASPCMSRRLCPIRSILMTLEQGQSISREAQPRPRNPFVANRLLIAVGLDSLPLGNQAYLDST